MNPLDKLQVYVTAAIAKTKNKQFRNVSDAIIDSLPEIVRTLTAIITANTSTTAERLRCLDILQVFWIRCLKVEGRNQKNLTDRERLKVKRTKAQAQNKRAALEIAAERKRISQALDKHARETQQNQEG